MPLARQYCVTFIYKKLSCSVNQYYSRAISNVTDNNDIVLSTKAATEVVDDMIAKFCTVRHCEKILGV